MTAALMSVCARLLCHNPLRARCRHWCRELLGLGAAGHRARGMRARADRGLHRIEIAGADEGLMLGGAIARALLAELALLQLRVAEHAVGSISRGQFEHGQIQRMPAGEGDELKAVAERSQLFAPP